MDPGWAPVGGRGWQVVSPGGLGEGGEEHPNIHRKARAKDGMEEDEDNMYTVPSFTT